MAGLDAGESVPKRGSLKRIKGDRIEQQESKGRNARSMMKLPEEFARERAVRILVYASMLELMNRIDYRKRAVQSWPHQPTEPEIEELLTAMGAGRYARGAADGTDTINESED